MRKELTVVVLLAVVLVAGLAALDASLGTAPGGTAASLLRVAAPAVLLMVFLLHRPIDLG